MGKCLVLCLLAGALAAVPLQAGGRERHRWSLGVNYGGGQIDWQPTPRWALELRVQRGSASDEAGRVTATAGGARLYRHFWTDRNPHFYAGLSAAAVEASRQSSPFKTGGVAAGAFLGLEIFWTSRLSFGFDAGPYYLDLKEKQTSVTQSDLDFVADACVKVHFL